MPRGADGQPLLPDDVWHEHHPAPQVVVVALAQQAAGFRWARVGADSPASHGRAGGRYAVQAVRERRDLTGRGHPAGRPAPIGPG
jgi:hypothetical protein